MKTMRIIDLLNKIAKGEEVPKCVRYYNMLENKEDIMMVCEGNIFYKLDQLEIQLNSRVEIIGEENKIEKIKNKNFTRNQKQIANKLNELIDEINKLKENK